MQLVFYPAQLLKCSMTSEATQMFGHGTQGDQLAFGLLPNSMFKQPP